MVIRLSEAMEYTSFYSSYSVPASVVSAGAEPAPLAYFSFANPSSTGSPALVRWSVRQTLRMALAKVLMSYQQRGLFVLQKVKNPLPSVLVLTQH